ncbi:hypothetical protein [Streptomyces sp. NPDC001914]|uniref:hypothetical protein n=1 Tax=Streptomyces sp. NPDC001914 TaxID=3364623 RepID=UPI0036A2F292
MLLVMVSISPVPKLLPGPVSYFHRLWSMPVPDAPLKSSLQVRLKPAGGEGTAASAFSAPTRVVATVTATTGTSLSALLQPPRRGRARGNCMCLDLRGKGMTELPMSRRG